MVGLGLGLKLGLGLELGLVLGLGLGLETLLSEPPQHQPNGASYTTAVANRKIFLTLAYLVALALPDFLITLACY